MSDDITIFDGAGLPDGWEFVNSGTGSVSYYSYNDTPTQYVQLRVNEQDVMIARHVGVSDVLVGIGGAMGSLVSIALDKVEAYIKRNTE